jgi:hypothetical protein
MVGRCVTPAQTGCKLRGDGLLTRSRGLLLYPSRCGTHRRNLSPHVFGYIKGDATAWRDEPLERLARDGELMAYWHDGFRQLRDTLQERCPQEDLRHKGATPWRGE